MKYQIALNPCPSLWASDLSHFGDNTTGTSRSHDVIRTLWIGIIKINQDQTKTSRKQKKTKTETKNKKLATSPGVRVVVETCFLFFGCFVFCFGLTRFFGASETDQSVEVPDTCFCEETCYRIAYIQNKLLWAWIAYIQNELLWAWVSSLNVYPKNLKFAAHNKPFRTENIQVFNIKHVFFMSLVVRM